MSVKILVPFSGGKDSQATLLWAVEKYGADKVTAVFCDTKWEHQITYDHIDYVVRNAGVKFVDLVSKKYDGFADLAVKKRFPSSTKRLCTIFLKVEPMIDFVLDSCASNIMIFQGIRANESAERSRMSEECRYFRYYFEPYDSNKMIVERYGNRLKLSKVQKSKLQAAQERLLLGKNDEKYHTYRKKDVFAWCLKYADDIRRPFFNATAEDVIYFSLNREYVVHPFYFIGISRIGCFSCIMASLAEMQIIVFQFVEIINKIRALEKVGKGTFFPPDYIPKHYHSGKVLETGKTFPYIDDVVRYISDRNATGDLFENDTELNRCKSVYAICE